MAEKEVASNPGAVEANDLTVCGVCLEEFEEPKVLPCCHTFCKGCLERVIEKSGQKESLLCPQCRAVHRVPVGGTDAFLTDFTVLQTFRIRSLTTKSKSCGMCSGHDIPPVSFCEECEEYLCEYCNGAHKRMKVFTDHNIVALSEFKVESFNPKPKPYYCQQHPQNVVQFFCQTCNQLICGNCVVHSQSLFAVSSKHGTHTLTTLSDGLKPMEEEVKKLIGLANRDRKQCESNLNSFEAIEKQRQHCTQQLKAQVNTSVDLYIKCLQALRVQTLKEIDAKSSEETDYNQTQKQRLRSAVTRIKSSLKFGLKALQCCDDTERITMIGHAISQLKQPIKPHIAPIKIKPPLVVENLEITLQTLLREFESSDMSIIGQSGDAHVQLGEKSQLKVTIQTKPVGVPQFLIKYGPSYRCSITPQTIPESAHGCLNSLPPAEVGMQ